MDSHFLLCSFYNLYSGDCSFNYDFHSPAVVTLILSTYFTECSVLDTGKWRARVCRRGGRSRRRRPGCRLLTE